MNKKGVLSFTYVPTLKDYQNKKEVKEIIVRNASDLTPFNTEPPNMELLIDRTIKPSDSLVVVHLDALLIGFSALTLDPLINGQEHIEDSLLIRTSILEPVFRNKGIGTLLYQEVESINEHILKRPTILRGTWDSNTTQHHLCKKLGYTLLNSPETTSTNPLKTYLYGKECVLQERILETVI